MSEPLAKLDAGDPAVRRCLLCDPSDNLGVRGPHASDADTSGEVDDVITVDVDQDAAAGLLDEHREGYTEAGRHLVSTPLLELYRLGARDRSLDEAPLKRLDLEISCGTYCSGGPGRLLVTLGTRCPPGLEESQNRRPHLEGVGLDTSIRRWRRTVTCAVRAAGVVPELAEHRYVAMDQLDHVERPRAPGPAGLCAIANIGLPLALQTETPSVATVGFFGGLHTWSRLIVVAA